MNQDPICGMTVDLATAFHAERDGETFYFCSEHCRKDFLSPPESSKHKEKKIEKQPQGETIYTCPMHPEVQQDHPGSCPKCGMALELKTLSAGNSEEDHAELDDMTRRFWIGAALLHSPIIAVVAMSLSSVSVIGNALRLQKIKL